MRRNASIIILFTLIALLQIAKAQTASAPVVQTIQTTQAAPSSSALIPSNNLLGIIDTSKSNFAGELAMGYSSNLYDKSAAESVGAGNYSARLDYAISGGANIIRTAMSGYQQENDGQKNGFNDGFIGWINGGFWGQGKILTTGQQVRMIIPMSEDSIKRDEKLTGVSVAPMFTLNLTPVGLTGVTVTLRPQATKNFNKYETNRSNVNNVSYSFSHLTSVVWAITDHVYMSSDLLYGLAWSYGGVKRDDSYTFTSEVGYQFSNGICLNGGISNISTIRNLENGNDQTLELFNNRTSTVYTELAYLF